MLIDDITQYVVSCVISALKLRSHLGTESSLVILNVRLVQWHHVISDFDEKFDGAETGGEPAGILFYLQLLANTHGGFGLSFTRDNG